MSRRPGARHVLYAASAALLALLALLVPLQSPFIRGWHTGIPFYDPCPEPRRPFLQWSWVVDSWPSYEMPRQMRSFRGCYARARFRALWCDLPSVSDLSAFAGRVMPKEAFALLAFSAAILVRPTLPSLPPQFFRFCTNAPPRR